MKYTKLLLLVLIVLLFINTTRYFFNLLNHTTIDTVVYFIVKARIKQYTKCEHFRLNSLKKVKFRQPCNDGKSDYI